MHSGENILGLRKILDMTRLISMVLLMLHCYYYCYEAFFHWGLTTAVSDRLLTNISRTGLFAHFHAAKVFALGLLCVALLGERGRKSKEQRALAAVLTMTLGALVYFGSFTILYLPFDPYSSALAYMGAVLMGYLMFLSGGARLSRVIYAKLDDSDIFNRENEAFPQEERLLENEYSINLRARYYYKGKWRKSWVNIINPFRSLLVLGTPGSGKSYFVIRHVIEQHIRKGFAMFVYDFKYDDLTSLAYNLWLQNRHRYEKPVKFYVINFDDLSQTHRCNPLEPSTMTDITDAAEAARTILLGLNRTWIRRQGDFFVESPINFLTAVIWYLKKYRDGKFCTLPHVIELIQTDYDKLFTLLRTEPEIQALITPFVNAYLNDAMEQLEGQMAAAQIALARLSSPGLYYVLSGNDFSLDINDPLKPKIVCMGNSPQKMQIYGAVLSLYINRIIKSVNRKGRMKCSLVFDEFPTVFINDMDSLIATARSNKVATCLGMQDLTQLRKDYGKEQADVIMNIVGNIISGQVMGDTARQLSERFGKILQEQYSISVNSTDVSFNECKRLEMALPTSRVSGLSSGEFVGMVTDVPECTIRLKTFHCQLGKNSTKSNEHSNVCKGIPMFRNLDTDIVIRNFYCVKQSIIDIIHTEIEQLLHKPNQECLIIKK